MRSVWHSPIPVRAHVLLFAVAWTCLAFCGEHKIVGGGVISIDGKTKAYMLTMGMPFLLKCEQGLVFTLREDKMLFNETEQAATVEAYVVWKMAVEMLRHRKQINNWRIE
jgi:hypothetical protein